MGDLGDEAMTCWMGVAEDGTIHFQFDREALTALFQPQSAANEE